MELMKVIEKRRSVREYQSREVSDEILNRILEAARLAPSARNRQPWKFIVVRDPKRRRELAEAARNQSFIGKAPVVIVGVALDPNHIMSSGVPAYAVNTGIAMEHIALAAQNEGLGTCWIGGFSQEEVRKLLGVPDAYKVACLMPMGYPADSQGTRIRKPLEEIICHEQYS